MNDVLRLGVIGLGSMGRHHARIAASLEDVEFVGGVDPAGDLHRVLAGKPCFADLEELLEAGVDAAVIAVPSNDHVKVARRLAEAGIHALIEKPLASDTGSAQEILDAFDNSSATAAVGHVERFNPALLEARRRLDEKALGHLFAITTRRVGPFPLRVGDIGVVKDLATHDLDIILWLCGPVESLSAQLAHRMGRPNEDLLEAVGRMQSGAVVSMSVNWLTPTKERTVTVLGDRGALVADLLSADLTFFANADVPMEWDEMARLKGVSEGDMIRYALRKREPLLAELESFRDYLLGRPGASIVSLNEGLEVVRLADHLIETAERP